MRTALEDVLLTEDDGSAGILLRAGMRMLNAVRSLYLTCVRMRNIMEVCLGTTEGMTQPERWARNATVYPTLYIHAFSARWRAEGDMSFDPKRHFQTMQTLDLSTEDPHWEYVTAQAQQYRAKRGKVSLLEKYRA